jgi:CRP-like cAMP-binding protein
MVAMLKEVPLLTPYGEEELATLGAALSQKNFKKGDYLCKEGDAGDGFFIIQSGSCIVTKTQGDGSQLEIGRLKDADYFGEMALINDQPRGATVRADTAISTFFLLRSDFRRLFNADVLDVKFAKRAGVSAEKMSSVTTKDDPERNSGVTLKDDATTAMLLKAVAGNVLFSGQNKVTRAKLVLHMYELHVPAGHTLIKQGDKGDLFYVVDSGHFSIDINGSIVCSKGPGECFGELALLYNAPRNATVKATEASVVWCIDRYVFRAVVKELSAAELNEYAGFLKFVPLLAPLTSFEREKVADLMDLVFFEEGETVFDQGAEGDAMYIVKSGEVLVEKDGKEVARCTKGDYFGERALCKNEPRAATIKAIGMCSFLRIGREAFQVLLGPLEDIMGQRESSYVALESAAAAAPTQSPTSKSRHIKFEDLTVLGTLGKGSFGHVQLVQDKTSIKTYALKGVSKAMVVETGQQSHLMSEKDVMAALKHPFLITLHQTFKVAFRSTMTLLTL